ncbi:MAG TPA: DUF6150 family protein [bacterium]|nr:DUF6150 family protein [bacterium]
MKKLLVLFLAALTLPAAAGLVYVVDAEYQADEDGLWYFVDAEYQADFTIYYVDAEYQADLLVYFVDAEYQAGWNASHELEGQLH